MDDITPEREIELGGKNLLHASHEISKLHHGQHSLSGKATTIKGK
jgi:hypothetical protein